MFLVLHGWLLKFSAALATWLSSCECTSKDSYEGLVPRYDEELRDPSRRTGVGHIEESEHLGWGVWVAEFCICVISSCLSEY